MNLAASEDMNENSIEKRIQDVQSSIVELQKKAERDAEKTQCLTQIEYWQEQMFNKIRLIAGQARSQVSKMFDESVENLSSSIRKLSDDVHTNTNKSDWSESIITAWMTQIKKHQETIETLPAVRITLPTEPIIEALRVELEMKKTEDNLTNTDAMETDFQELNNELYPKIDAPHGAISAQHPCMTFGLNATADKIIEGLFNDLMLLPPMNKYAMNGKCRRETDQMIRFLENVFGFENIPGRHIVPGVRDFRLKKTPDKIPPATTIEFPSKHVPKRFLMSGKEILQWQNSFTVYASRRFPKLTKDFIHKALQGRSEDGEEAFLMKFVIRISKCPILMEFDGEVIDRQSHEKWPNNIKLVSVTGIDFAARRHDICDIYQYIVNWPEIFLTDSRNGSIMLINDRDLALKSNPASVELRQGLLFQHLTLMARLRLQACDREGVAIVVETGIGLGVFSGRKLGIEPKIQTASALAIRAVLEEDGPSYKNIRGVIFALPIFHSDRNYSGVESCFHVFTHHFLEPEYKGRIPVLIADQDMHRLTVAIAKRGFTVSELNPADSHGVFGEYWQNYGPAVEEKLALTTAGLLIQHHRFNNEVLNKNKYNFID